MLDSKSFEEKRNYLFNNDKDLVLQGDSINSLNTDHEFNDIDENEEDNQIQVQIFLPQSLSRCTNLKIIYTTVIKK